MNQVGVAAAPLCKVALDGATRSLHGLLAAVPSHELVPEPREPVSGMRLVASRGPATGAEFAISAALTLLGRHRDCDIVIDDVTVSRYHAELAVRGGRCVLVDGGSLNGTYVNRRSVESAELADGDEIWIGKMRFTFRAGDGEAAGITTKRRGPRCGTR